MNPLDASYSQFSCVRVKLVSFSNSFGDNTLSLVTQALKFYKSCFILSSLKLPTKIEYALLWKSYIMVVSQARSRHLACIVCSPFHTIHLSLSGGGCTSLVLVSFPLNYWTKEFGKNYSYRKFPISRIYRPPKLYERIEVRHNHPATPDQRHDVSRSTDTDRIRWSPCCWILCSHQNPDYAQPQVGN